MVAMNMEKKIARILAHQLRQRTANQTIPEINDEHGSKCLDSHKINSCFQNFYQALFTSECPTTPSVLENFLRSQHVPSVDPNLAESLEKDFSALEIISAIRFVQSGKSPGAGRISVRFLQKNLRPACPFTNVTF